MFQQRRARWAAIRADERINLVQYSDPNVYELTPLSESELFDAGRGRYSHTRSTESQTGGLRDDQDCQTDDVGVRNLPLPSERALRHSA